MKIAVIDDERPARSELIHLLNELAPDAEIFEADSGASALEVLSRDNFDLVFIDINLGDLEGTVLASTVRKLMPKAHIIFATAYSQYAVQAFEIGVENYILKPFEKQRLECIFENYQKQQKANSLNILPGKLPVNNNRRIVFIDINSIVFIETLNRSCIIHTWDGDLIEHLSLVDYEKKLASYRFFRIHKSYLVNLDQIQEIFPWHNHGFALKMKGYEKEVLPVGREKIKGLRQLLKF